MSETVPQIAKLTSAIYRCTQSYVDRALQPVGLGIGTYPVLFCLASNEGINQNRLSDILAVDKAWTARAVLKLLGAGYIRKTSDPSDARAWNLFLTDRGRKVVPRVKAVLIHWNDLIGQGLSDEERTTAFRLLGRVLENAKRHRSDDA